MDEKYFEFGGLLFDWDPAKAETNWRKHGITFQEAASVFGDASAQFYPDPKHSGDEDRFLLVGVSEVSRVLVVVSVERAEIVRLISARKAIREERRVYEEAAG